MLIAACYTFGQQPKATPVAEGQHSPTIPSASQALLAAQADFTVTSGALGALLNPTSGAALEATQNSEFAFELPMPKPFKDSIWPHAASLSTTSSTVIITF